MATAPPEFFSPFDLVALVEPNSTVYTGSNSDHVTDTWTFPEAPHTKFPVVATRATTWSVTKPTNRRWNYIPDPNAGNLGAWFVGGFDSQWSVSATQAWTGSTSLRFAGNGTSGCYLTSINVGETGGYGTAKAVAGEIFSISFRFWSDDTAQTPYVNFDWLNAHGGLISTNGSSTFTVTASAWNQCTFTSSAAPAGTAFVKVTIIGFPTVANTKFSYFDGFVFEKASSAGAYFDGTSAASRWLGDVNGSTSMFGTVDASRATTWDVAYTATTTPVTASRATSWSTDVAVSSTRATTWQVRSVATGTRATTWAVKAALAAPATRATTWNALASVTDAQSTTWSVLQSATSSRSTVWDAKAAVSAARATTYDVKATVSGSRATLWDILSAVREGYLLEDDSGDLLMEDGAGIYILDGVVSVTASRATSWQVRSATASTRSTSWNVLTPASSSRLTSWDVKGAVGSTRATSWNVLTPVTPSTRATTWSAKAAIAASRATSWSVKGSVSGSRMTLWDTKGRVSPSRATTWSVLVAVATPTTRATTWKTFQSVGSTRSTTWNVSILEPVIESWGLIKL